MSAVDDPRAPAGRFREVRLAVHPVVRHRAGVLALGHLFVVLIADDGVILHRLQLGRAALVPPAWRTWDLLLLWLALLHGGNGMRTIIADYSRKDSTRFWLTGVLAVSIVLTLVLGTYVPVTFDPNIS